MDVYQNTSIEKTLAGNSYAGRGIIIGKTSDAKKACIAYFIMGRSANSRNRILQVENDVLYTKPFDENKVEDPSLIIYAALRKLDNKYIVTNGDQTDTIYEGLKKGKTFTQALQSRCFEPDAPNFTPRISGMLTFDEGDFSYEMSILKSADEKGTACNRFTFSYSSLPGTGHFLHTYEHDGNPLPTFQGEPKRISIPNSIDDFASGIWGSLQKENKISLYVQTVDLQTGESETCIINKNEGEKR